MNVLLCQIQAVCISNHHKSNIADSLLTDVIPSQVQVRIDKSGSGPGYRVNVADKYFLFQRMHDKRLKIF